ncbi:hypothetical protein WHX56_22290 [Achromobacter veterisilvae]|uniref:Uncharacterized protein n=1 Tax=Achromobacter veterisilvae TaxID=2069367 RepID=A0ABZ2S2C9_9BURK
MFVIIFSGKFDSSLGYESARATARMQIGAEHGVMEKLRGLSEEIRQQGPEVAPDEDFIKLFAA